MIESTRDITGLRVLVAEDEPLILMLLEDALEELGCELVGAYQRIRHNSLCQSARQRKRGLQLRIMTVDNHRLTELMINAWDQGPRRPLLSVRLRPVMSEMRVRCCLSLVLASTAAFAA